jgi:hypothetical protein
MAATSTTVGPTRYADAREVPQGVELVRQVRESKKTLSAFLEECNPSDEGEENDAYERQLERYDIRTQDDTVRGIPASTVGEFKDPRAASGQPLERSRWAADGVRFESNQPESWALFPEYINRLMRVQPLAEDVLNYLVAVTTTINEAGYQSIYLQDTVTERRMSRVAEGAEIPRIFARIATQSAHLDKYALALEMTYEVLRRIRIPLFDVIVGRVRSQIRLDQAAQAVDVVVNGDGNNNAAQNFNVSTLDPSAAAGPGTVTDPYLAQIGDPTATSTIAKRLTYPALLQWRASLYPMGMTTIFGRMNELLQVLTLQFPSVDPTALLAMLEGGDQAQMGRVKLPTNNLWRDVNLVYLPSAPGGLLVGINGDAALEMLMEDGSDISENDRDILRQRTVMTVSQNTSFDKILQSASTTLSLQ